MTAKAEDKIGNALRWWPVIVAVISVAAAFGGSTAQIAGIGKSQDKVLERLDVISAKLEAATNSISAVQARAGFNGDRIAALESRLRDIERGSYR